MRVRSNKAVFRLDYLSCILTILSTVLIGRKLWSGLVVASVNSLVVCVIGARTAQLGFIPANVFCVIVYAISIRSWLKERAAQPVAARQEAHL